MKEAENYSDEDYKVVIKWSKIKDEGLRKYQRCFGAPFMIQLSGSGLVAPCGMLFNEKYKKFHMGNFCLSLKFLTGSWHRMGMIIIHIITVTPE